MIRLAQPFFFRLAAASHRLSTGRDLHRRERPREAGAVPRLGPQGQVRRPDQHDRHVDGEVPLPSSLLSNLAACSHSIVISCHHPSPQAAPRHGRSLPGRELQAQARRLGADRFEARARDLAPSCCVLSSRSRDDRVASRGLLRQSVGLSEVRRPAEGESETGPLARRAVTGRATGPVHVSRARRPTPPPPCARPRDCCEC